MALLTFENRLGKEIETDQYSITPVEQSFEMKPSGLSGFFFWRKPSSVIVEYPDGKNEVIEIIDTTRQVQVAIVGITVFITFTLWLVRTIQGRK